MGEILQLWKEYEGVQKWLNIDNHVGGSMGVAHFFWGLFQGKSENQMDDLGVPPFMETPTYIYICMIIYVYIYINMS